MHRSTGMPEGHELATHEVTWKNFFSVEDWLAGRKSDTWKQQFERDGCLQVDGILLEEELAEYRDVYDKFLAGEIDASSHRQDLGKHIDEVIANKENITQVMWPSVYVKNLRQGPLHERALAVSRIILGDDMAFDFEMMISKSPHTDTATPWHQDAAYWLDLPDKRSVSCWTAMDESTLDNGCMWFGVGSHKKPLREHLVVKAGKHVLMAEGITEADGKPFPLKPGSCTFHGGHTLHYSRGNTTDTYRRAYITNFRPQAMVDHERAHNYDHGFRGIAEGTQGQTHGKQT